MKKRICVFCGAGDLTKEHVFPVWISKMLEPGVTVTTTIEQSGAPRQSFTNRLLRHTVKIVCYQCNNNWMSRLETDVKPILSKMLFDLNYTTSLSEIEQNILAFWAQKTTLILGISTRPDYTIPKQFYESLYAKRSPISEISVRLGWRIPKQDEYGRHFSHFTVGEVTGPNRTEMTQQVGEFEIWRAILVIGNVVFHVNGATPNIRVEVDNFDPRVTPQIFPYVNDLEWPLEWPVDALTNSGWREFSSV